MKKAEKYSNEEAQRRFALFAGGSRGAQCKFNCCPRKKATAERVEVEKVLQRDLDNFAEGLRSIWKILLAIDALCPGRRGPVIRGAIHR
jgi:hypothetical protein